MNVENSASPTNGQHWPMDGLYLLEYEAATEYGHTLAGTIQPIRGISLQLETPSNPGEPTRQKEKHVAEKDEFLDKVKAMAKELGLKGDDAVDYIRRHAKAKGYREIPNFVKPDSDEGKGFFGSGDDDSGGDSGNRGGGWFKG